MRYIIYIAFFFSIMSCINNAKDKDLNHEFFINSIKQTSYFNAFNSRLSDNHTIDSVFKHLIEKENKDTNINTSKVISCRYNMVSFDLFPIKKANVKSYIGIGIVYPPPTNRCVYLFDSEGKVIDSISFVIGSFGGDNISIKPIINKITPSLLLEHNDHVICRGTSYNSIVPILNDKFGSPLTLRKLQQTCFEYHGIDTKYGYYDSLVWKIQKIKDTDWNKIDCHQIVKREKEWGTPKGITIKDTLFSYCYDTIKNEFVSCE